MTSDIQISGRGVRERDAGQTVAGEFRGDGANARANVEKMKLGERPAADFREE
jgi:hypothetical protein